MKREATRRSIALAVGIIAVSFAPWVAVRAADGPGTVEVRGGVAMFDAATNVSAISIHGKSSALEGRAAVRPGADGLVIERLEAVVPVKTLNTGMGLRDEHMRKHVFTTADGQVPDLRFTADKTVCSGSENRTTCQLSGELSIRGTPKPFTMALNVTREGTAFRAVGESTIKLSAYGIPLPSQLGVKTEDDVKLRLDFVARPSSITVAIGGAK